MDKISIIVPVYKVEKYLNKCVESIVNQTYKNLEIILVDDGSPDNCPQICDEWAKKDDRIKVIHKENGGQVSARNMALDIANGEYIAFVDSDDYIDTTMYEKLIKTAIQNNADIVRCMYNRVYENGEVIPVIENNLAKINSANIINYYISGTYIKSGNVIVTGNIAPNIWSCLYSKNIIGDKRFENQTIGEDFLFNCSLVSPDVKISYVNEHLYNYLIREGSTMTVMNEEKIAKRIEFAKRVFDVLKNKVDEQDLYGYKFARYKEVILGIAASQNLDIYKNKKNEIDEVFKINKTGYKIYCKQKRSFRDKMIDWLVYKKKLGILKVLYKFKNGK